MSAASPSTSTSTTRKIDRLDYFNSKKRARDEPVKASPAKKPRIEGKAYLRNYELPFDLSPLEKLEAPASLDANVKVLLVSRFLCLSLSSQMT